MPADLSPAMVGTAPMSNGGPEEEAEAGRLLDLAKAVPLTPLPAEMPAASSDHI